MSCILILVTNPFEDENGDYLVLINEEGQYSLWPAFLDIPPGWMATGPRGRRQRCLDWIDEHWTDMRPLSLVRQMEEDARSRSKSRQDAVGGRDERSGDASDAASDDTVA